MHREGVSFLLSFLACSSSNIYRIHHEHGDNTRSCEASRHYHQNRLHRDRLLVAVGGSLRDDVVSVGSFRNSFVLVDSVLHRDGWVFLTLDGQKTTLMRSTMMLLTTLMSTVIEF